MTTELRVMRLRSEAHPCPYLAGKTARFEEYLVPYISPAALPELMVRGYRHFGQHVFRPACGDCNACIPIRIRVNQFRKTRSVKRAFRRNRDLEFTVSQPVPSPDAFRLYLAHKTRFQPPREQETYKGFCRSLFHPSPFARTLEMRLGNALVAVTHFDIVTEAISAVYCYYDPQHAGRGLGKLAIYTQIVIALEHHIPYVYLGYFVRDNPHMSYKKDYVPNEVLLDGQHWTPFMDSRHRSVLPEVEVNAGFRPGRALDHEGGTLPGSDQYFTEQP